MLGPSRTSSTLPLTVSPISLRLFRHNVIVPGMVGLKKLELSKLSWVVCLIRTSESRKDEEELPQSQKLPSLSLLLSQH